MWLYGSGFPKSMSLGNTIEKKKSIESNKWKGWGTCLKPAYEPIIVARKPFKGTLVDNVIKNGVGGLNIDECRVGTQELHNKYAGNKNGLTCGDTRTEKGKGLFAGNKEGETIVKGRFPANVILTYDQITIDEVCGGMPYTKKNGNITNQYEKTQNVYGKYPPTQKWEAYNDKGSASRYFKNCQYTRKDEDIWKNLYVNNVEKNLRTIQVIKESIAQMNVEDLLNELKSRYAKYVESQSDLLETSIVQDIAEILTWDFKIETSQVIQDFIINSEKCIQFQNLVQFVENLDSIDTTQTTQNLLKLFGYVKVVIINYIQGNLKYEQKRYIYKPKASKKDRDEGLDMFDYDVTNDGRKVPPDNPFQRYSSNS